MTLIVIDGQELHEQSFNEAMSNSLRYFHKKGVDITLGDTQSFYRVYKACKNIVIQDFQQEIAGQKATIESLIKHLITIKSSEILAVPICDNLILSLTAACSPLNAELLPDILHAIDECTTLQAKNKSLELLFSGIFVALIRHYGGTSRQAGMCAAKIFNFGEKKPEETYRKLASIGGFQQMLQAVLPRTFLATLCLFMVMNSGFSLTKERQARIQNRKSHQDAFDSFCKAYEAMIAECQTMLTAFFTSSEHTAKEATSRLVENKHFSEYQSEISCVSRVIAPVARALPTQGKK